MSYRALTPNDVSIAAKHIFRAYGVDKAVVFGSCARGDMHWGSDIDIAVSFGLAQSGFAFIDLKRKLESRLKRKVDLFTLRTLETAEIWETIKCEMQVIYEKGFDDSEAHAG